MSSTSSADTISNRSWPHILSTLGATLILAAALPVGIAYLFYQYLPTWNWQNPALHATLEGLGTAITLALAAAIWALIRRQRIDPRLVWIAMGLVAMGVVNAIDAASPREGQLTWLHGASIMTGGLAFGLAALPKYWSETAVRFPLYSMIFFTALVFSTSFLLIPALGILHTPQNPALLAHLIGGGGFLMAWLYFSMGPHQQTPGRILLPLSCLLFATTTLLFQLAAPWDSAWWLGKILRLSTYLVLGGYLFSCYARQTIPDSDLIQGMGDEIWDAPHQIQPPTPSNKEPTVEKQRPISSAHFNGEAATLEHPTRPSPLENEPIESIHGFTHPNRDGERKQEQPALYDDLTQLPNRPLFEDRLGQELKGVNRNFNSIILMLLNLDGFHDIDHSLGQGSSDMLLLEACRRIQSCIHELDTLARLEGNQFIIMLGNKQDLKTAERISGDIIQQLGDKFTIREHELNISVNIGISIAPENGRSYRALIMHARSAMEKAKVSGLNSYRFSSEELHIKMLHRQDLEQQLQTALREQALRLLYQPKLDLSGSQIIGMEALMRWPHPLRGSIPPNQFMPVAEDSDLIVKLDDWALYWACKDAADWIQSGHRPLRVSLNLSSEQFEQEDLVQKIEGILKANGLPPQYLELELNESMIMKNYIKSIGRLKQLKALGVRATVDNFGTTHIPLPKLKRLPVQGLKIDKGFIASLGKSSDDDTIVSAMISLANTMELEVIAEGVETEAQMEYLRKEGCNQIQGHYLGHPLAKRDFFNFVRAHELTQEAVKRLCAQSKTTRPRNPKRPT